LIKIQLFIITIVYEDLTAAHSRLTNQISAYPIQKVESSQREIPWDGNCKGQSAHDLLQAAIRSSYDMCFNQIAYIINVPTKLNSERKSVPTICLSIPESWQFWSNTHNLIWNVPSTYFCHLRTQQSLLSLTIK